MQHDFILLDRSGSMVDRWSEAINSVNIYVEKLVTENVDTGVTLAVFDTPENDIEFTVLRDRIVPKTWKKVDVAEARPRGWTPLNDAIGRIVTLANAGNYAKLALIIITDGHENRSKELNHLQAKKLLDDCRAKGWQVIFMGCDFDNAQQAATFGNAIGQTVAVAAQNMDAAMASTASMRGLYGSGKVSNMSYSDEDKKRFANKAG